MLFFVKLSYKIRVNETIYTQVTDLELVLLNKYLQCN